MKSQWLKMDGRIFEIYKWDYVDKTVVLWGLDGNTTRIPLFFLTNPGFTEALKIEILKNKPEVLNERC